MMKADQPPFPKLTQQAPAQVLHHFCTAYTSHEAQQALWKWCILALKSDYDGLSSARTTNLITFYENLKALISAVYQLHDHTRQAQEAALKSNEQLPSTAQPSIPGPLSNALDTLYNSLPHNWTLLICPPE